MYIPNYNYLELICMSDLIDFFFKASLVKKFQIILHCLDNCLIFIESEQNLMRCGNQLLSYKKVNLLMNFLDVHYGKGSKISKTFHGKPLYTNEFFYPV